MAQLLRCKAEYIYLPAKLLVITFVIRIITRENSLTDGKFRLITKGIKLRTYNSWPGFKWFSFHKRQHLLINFLSVLKLQNKIDH